MEVVFQRRFGETILSEPTKYMRQVAVYSEYIFKEAYKEVNPFASWKINKNLGFYDAVTKDALSRVHRCDIVFGWVETQFFALIIYQRQTA